MDSASPKTSTIFGHTKLTYAEELYRPRLGQELIIEPINYVQWWGGVFGLI